MSLVHKIAIARPDRSLELLPEAQEHVIGDPASRNLDGRPCSPMIVSPIVPCTVEGLGPGLCVP